MLSFRENLLGFPTITHVQRTYNWDFLLPDLYGVLVSGLVISKYCQSVRFRQYDISEISELKASIFKKFFPNTLSIDQVSASFISPVPDLVSLYFSKWKSLIVDDLGRYSLPSEYKRTGHVVFYDRSGIPSNIIRLVGMFPVKFPAYDLSYSREDAVKFDVNFRVEKIEMGFKALSGFAGEVVGAAGGAIKAVTGALGV